MSNPAQFQQKFYKNRKGSHFTTRCSALVHQIYFWHHMVSDPQHDFDVDVKGYQISALCA